MELLDLPVDVLLLIFPYLDVPSFVSLTSTCKALHDSDISEYSAFWSSATRSTFRVPNQPVVQNDGKRWQKLYKRLLTQSRVFTWGNNAKANLGHSFETHAQLAALPPPMRRRRTMRGRHVSWPTEMDNTHELGIIADLQSGGWSTTLLTSTGALFSVGVMDGLQFNQRQPPYQQEVKTKQERLPYPPGFPHPSERYDPTTAIQQFSAGRSHVLGLSDNGSIWSWNNIDQAALNVKFLNVELRITRGSTVTSAVRKVVAGWNKSAALVAGTGIVLWEPLARSHNETEIEDAALVLETAVVPGTGFQRSKVSNTTAHGPEDARLGEVLNFICLEHFVVFHTSLGKIFASRITWSDRQQEASPPFEIKLSAQDDSEDSTMTPGDSTSELATDVQGSFRSFAIFTNDGAVYTGNSDHLQARFEQPTNTRHPPLVQIPALQHTQVISVAFGDYHFHALHAPGYITSYGTESQGCGSLGLGGHGDPEGRLRGLRYAGVGGDGRLVPHAYSSGRRIWFEREKRDWIRFLTSGGNDPEEARERMRMCAETVVQGEVSEWVEQEGNAWESKYGPSKFVGDKNDEENDGFGAYFALSVTAAGWHSGALVLVNEDIADRVREGCVIRSEPQRASTHQDTQDSNNAVISEPQRGILPQALSYAEDWGRWLLGFPPYAAQPGSTSTRNGNEPQQGGAARSAPGISSFLDLVNHGAALDENTAYKWKDDPFPRLRLSDGREMPGTADFCEWRSGQRPAWDLGFQV